MRGRRSSSMNLYMAIDWVTIVALVAIDVALNLAVHPFQRFVGETTMLASLMYPLKGDTVPFWLVPILVIGIPMAVFLLQLKRTRDLKDFHHAVLGLLFAIGVTAVITDALKNAIGQPRPDFFWRCFPDGKVIFDNATNKAQCSGNISDIREGHKSFPSGHSSWSFAGMGFLAMYLVGKFDIKGKGVALRFFVIFAPLGLATAIAVTRLDDYMHRWQDVLVGAIIGLIVAATSHYQSFSRSDANSLHDPNILRLSEQNSTV